VLGESFAISVAMFGLETLFEDQGNPRSGRRTAFPKAESQVVYDNVKFTPLSPTQSDHNKLKRGIFV
jgi:hypothetical protein